MINIDVTIYHTNSYFGSKFSVCFGFTTYYGANMGLADADDAVFDLVNLVGVHLSLLAVKFPDCCQFPSLPGAQITMSLKLEK